MTPKDVASDLKINNLLIIINDVINFAYGNFKSCSITIFYFCHLSQRCPNLKECVKRIQGLDM